PGRAYQDHPCPDRPCRVHPDRARGDHQGRRPVHRARRHPDRQAAEHHSAAGGHSAPWPRWRASSSQSGRTRVSWGLLFFLYDDWLEPLVSLESEKLKLKSIDSSEGIEPRSVIEGADGAMSGVSSDVCEPVLATVVAVDLAAASSAGEIDTSSGNAG